MSDEGWGFMQDDPKELEIHKQQFNGEDNVNQNPHWDDLGYKGKIFFVLWFTAPIWLLIIFAIVY